MTDSNDSTTTMQHPDSGSSDGIFLTTWDPRSRPRVTIPNDTTIDRFRFLRSLGRGRLTDVYLAEDEVRGEEVALKIVQLRPGEPCPGAEWLRREVAIRDRIANSDHVVRTYDLHALKWGDAGLLAMSMEYADGGTLRDWLTQNRDDVHLRQSQGVKLFRRICEGVRAVHDSGFLHLDLKPENVLFVGDVLKLADFGASQGAPLDPLGSLGDEPVQNVSTWVGTPAYMSPEAFAVGRYGGLNQQADIYSLGLIMYEILHPEGRMVSNANRAAEQILVDDLQFIPDPMRTTREVIRRCISREPACRFGSVAELLDVLDGREVPSQTEEDLLPLNDAEALWERAQRHFEKQEFGPAGRLCQMVLDLNEGVPGPKAMLKDIRARETRAMQLYKEAEYRVEGHGLDPSTKTVVLDLFAQADAAYPGYLTEYTTSVLRKVRIYLYNDASSTLAWQRNCPDVSKDTLEALERRVEMLAPERQDPDLLLDRLNARLSGKPIDPLAVSQMSIHELTEKCNVQ